MSPDNIIQIFRRVLATDEVTADSDFFDLGGDSLLATRVLSAIARDCDIELMYDDFVENPSPAGLSDKLAGVTL
jgi:acyl carrier protein